MALLDFDASTVAPRLAVDTALDLARAGFAVFPCRPGGDLAKRPYFGIEWRKASTTDERRIRQWWSRWPDAMPGVDLAKTPFMVIDLDGPKGFADWDAIGIAETPPYVDTPSGGRHLYYRRPAGRPLGNGRGALPPKDGHEGIDVRGAGGYVIGPGGLRTDLGLAYEGSLEEIATAPELPAALADLIDPPRQQGPAPLPVVASPPSDARIRAYVEVALTEEARAVAFAPAGGRNEQLNRSAFALGQMVGAGWLTEADVRAALTTAAEASGLTKDDGPRQVAKTIASGLSAGRRQPREGLPEDERDSTGAEIARAIIKGADGTIADAETGEVIEAPAVHDPTAVARIGEGVDWTRPAGLLGGMVDWIMATSRRPNRPLAVAAATATLSTVCGRHLFSPTESSLNVYIVGLAASTIGKGRPLSAPYEFLHDAKLAQLYTSLKGFSVSAFERLIVDKPVCIATVDEIAANLLTRISHRNSSTHELAIKGALLELWSRERGQAPFSTHHRADSASVEVPDPSISILGMSTPEVFYGSLTASSVRDGFMNRFLLVAAGPRAPRVDHITDRRVPAAVSAQIAAIVPAVPGNMNALGVFQRNVDYQPDKLEWDRPETDDLFKRFEDDMMTVVDSVPDIGVLFGRVSEYAVRLASLHAISRLGRRAVVTAADLAWGAAWARASANMMVEGASSMMASNDYETKFNLIRKVIREAGVIAQRELLRRVRSVNARERDDIIKHLKQGGYIEDCRLESSGRTAAGYRWIG